MRRAAAGTSAISWKRATVRAPTSLDRFVNDIQLQTYFFDSGLEAVSIAIDAALLVSLVARDLCLVALSPVLITVGCPGY